MTTYLFVNVCRCVQTLGGCINAGMARPSCGKQCLFPGACSPSRAESQNSADRYDMSDLPCFPRRSSALFEFSLQGRPANSNYQGERGFLLLPCQLKVCGSMLQEHYSITLPGLACFLFEGPLCSLQWFLERSSRDLERSLALNMQHAFPKLPLFRIGRVDSTIALVQIA